MFKNLSKTTKLFAVLILGVIVIMIIMISISGNKVSTRQQTQYVNDNASADNKVEALKTMTADLVNVENKNKQLQENITQLQTENKNSISDLKKTVSVEMKQALATIQSQNQQQKILDVQSAKKTKTQSYPINGSNDVSDGNAFVWVSDLSTADDTNINSKTGGGLLNFANHNSSDSDSLLHDKNNLLLQNNSNNKKDLVTPAYTIPVNATLTGATLMSPLVGRIPIDGQLPSPYNFKLVLSSSNLTANGYPMPGVKGAVLSGIASGDLLGSCARGDIHSITFIFNDGTISTTQTSGDDKRLGYISSQTGNPCIPGTFHSDAAIFLGAQMAFAGAQGYANAISDSQYMTSNTPDNGGSIRTLIGSANKAAIGQGGSAAAQAAQTWWNRRVQNSFDYVYVSNVNSKTGHSMKVVVNITKQIPINHDSNARKVNYENSLQTNHNQLD
ncbi:MAG: TIGR03752 family integrating conjugative element protein [Coxiellaceae bacterium]|nr:TIGR03752 family integrating conjugative element protein [Coxiellaceae bacterium]